MIAPFNRSPSGVLACAFVIVVGIPFAVVGQDTPRQHSLSLLNPVFGKGPNSAEVSALRKELRGEPEISKFDDCFFHSWKSEGVSLRFEKKGVTTIFLYAQGADGFTQFRGELPEGLLFSDTRQDVEKKLGKPTTSGGDGVIPFWVSYPDKGMSLTYVSKDVKDPKNKIHHLALNRAVTAIGGRAEDVRARTEDGKDVILHADGTWSYVGGYRKDKKATLAYKGKKGTFAMYLVPDTWKKLDKSDNEAAEVGFVHKDGDIQALIIAERIEIPLETLKKGALENVRAVDKNAKIVREEKRTVNGKELLCLTIEASVEGIAVTYYGYYYTGDEGSIQILTFTGRKLFKELKPEMEAFLNGFEIVKKIE